MHKIVISHGMSDPDRLDYRDHNIPILNNFLYSILMPVINSMPYINVSYINSMPSKVDTHLRVTFVYASAEIYPFDVLLNHINVKIMC